MNIQDNYRRNPFEEESQWIDWFEADTRYLKQKKLSKQLFLKNNAHRFAHKTAMAQKNTFNPLTSLFKLRTFSVATMALIVIVIGFAQFQLLHTNKATDQVATRDNSLPLTKIFKPILVSAELLSEDENASEDQRAQKRLSLISNTLNAEIEQKINQGNKKSLTEIEDILAQADVPNLIWYRKSKITGAFSQGPGAIPKGKSPFIIEQTNTPLINRYIQSSEGKVDRYQYITPTNSVRYDGGEFAINSIYAEPLSGNTKQNNDILQSDRDFYNGILNQTLLKTQNVEKNGVIHDLYEDKKEKLLKNPNDSLAKFYVNPVTFEVMIYENYRDGKFVYSNELLIDQNIKVEDITKEIQLPVNTKEIQLPPAIKTAEDFAKQSISRLGDRQILKPAEFKDFKLQINIREQDEYNKLLDSNEYRGLPPLTGKQIQSTGASVDIFDSTNSNYVIYDSRQEMIDNGYTYNPSITPTSILIDNQKVKAEYYDAPYEIGLVTVANYQNNWYVFTINSQLKNTYETVTTKTVYDSFFDEYNIKSRVVQYTNTLAAKIPTEKALVSNLIYQPKKALLQTIQTASIENTDTCYTYSFSISELHECIVVEYKGLTYSYDSNSELGVGASTTVFDIPLQEFSQKVCLQRKCTVSISDKSKEIYQIQFTEKATDTNLSVDTNLVIYVSQKFGKTIMYSNIVKIFGVGYVAKKSSMLFAQQLFDSMTQNFDTIEITKQLLTYKDPSID
jgi:hypothetical protein